MSGDNKAPAASQADVFSGMVAAVLDAVGRQEQQVAEHVRQELHPPAPATTSDPAPDSAPETAT